MGWGISDDNERHVIRNVGLAREFTESTQNGLFDVVCGRPDLGHNDALQFVYFRIAPVGRADEITKGSPVGSPCFCDTVRVEDKTFATSEWN